MSKDNISSIDAKTTGTSSSALGTNELLIHNKRAPSYFYYDKHGKHGLMIVFNHFKYRKGYFRKVPNERVGTSSDTKRLRDVFERLNFKVQIHNDLTYNEIVDELQNVAREDHTSTSCLTIVVLTHGESSGILLASDREYKIQDLWFQLQGDICPNLIKIPKLFFIQACRGASLDDGIEVDSTTEHGMKLPTMADFLLMYSTMEDYVSWRDAGGSWFIQALCDEVEQHHESLDLMQILTLVNWRVAYTRSSYNPSKPNLNEKKQMPQIVSMLTKLFRF